MKKLIIALVAMFSMTFTTASAMSYEQARQQALFLTDKMAYELNLTISAQQAISIVRSIGTPDISISESTPDILAETTSSSVAHISMPFIVADIAGE